MYILNSLYLSIALHRSKMNEYFDNDNISIKYEKILEIKENIICFKIENIITNNSTLSNIKYLDYLEFSYNKSTKYLNISKLPSYMTKREKVNVFTSDIANIILECLGDYSSIGKIVFDNKTGIFVIDDRVANLIPSIIETEYFEIFNSIIEKINVEQKRLGISKLEDINIKRERVLSNRRKLLGIDPYDYDNEQEFYDSVNLKSRELFDKYIYNLERHIRVCRIDDPKLKILTERIKKAREILENNNQQFYKVIHSYDGWGYVLQFPYWYRLGKFDHFTNYNLLMIKPGTTNFKEDDLRVFVENVNSQYNKEFDIVCRHLCVSIPASLDIESLSRVINFAFKKGSRINFICENENVASLLIKILVRKEIDLFNSRSDFFKKVYFVSVDFDYYNSFLVELLYNRKVWNKYSYAFNPKYKYQIKNSYDLSWIIRKCIKLYLNDFPSACLDVDKINEYVEKYEGYVDGRLFFDTDDRVLALMLVSPKKWKELLPYIYYYCDQIFKDMFIEQFPLSILELFLTKEEKEVYQYEEKYIKTRICTYSGEFSIKNELVGISSLIFSPKFLAEKRVMLVFKEIFQENWQEHWFRCCKEEEITSYERKYYEYVLGIYLEDESQGKGNSKKRIKELSKQAFINRQKEEKIVYDPIGNSYLPF